MGKKVRLWFKSGRSDKEYVAILKPGVGGYYNVEVFWERRESTLQSKTFTFPLPKMASNFWRKKINEKLLEGYTLQESNCEEYRVGIGITPEGYLNPYVPLTPVAPREREEILDGKVPQRRIDI